MSEGLTASDQKTVPQTTQQILRSDKCTEDAGDGGSVGHCPTVNYDDFKKPLARESQINNEGETVQRQKFESGASANKQVCSLPAKRQLSSPPELQKAAELSPASEKGNKKPCLDIHVGKDTSLSNENNTHPGIDIHASYSAEIKDRDPVAFGGRDDGGVIKETSHNGEKDLLHLEDIGDVIMEAGSHSHVLQDAPCSPRVSGLNTESDPREGSCRATHMHEHNAEKPKKMSKLQLRFEFMSVLPQRIYLLS